MVIRNKAALAALLILPSAAAPAAAQLRGVVAVEVLPTQPAVQAVGMGVINGLPTTLPLNPLSLSLTPSLSAPSASLQINAAVSNTHAVLPSALHPDAVAVSVSVSVAVPIRSAPSKADDIRSQSTQSIAHWQAAKGLSPSALPPAAAVLTSPLDSFFDGSLPSSREILARANSQGLSERSLAQALVQSQSPSDAATRLSALGLLGSKEASLAVTREDEFRFLLTRVWRKTSPSVPSSTPVDETYTIPALKVVRGGVTYFVHGVAHGQNSPPRRGAVLALTRAVVAAGHALYSEQNLPAYYGYTAGRETLDHKAPDGTPTTVVAAAPGFTPASLLIKRAIDWAVTPGTAVASLIWGLLAHASIWPWACLGVSLALALFVLAGGLPYLRMLRRRRAAQARAAGLEDIADQYADEARNFFVANPDLEVLRGLELPLPLGSSASDA